MHKVRIELPFSPMLCQVSLFATVKGCATLARRESDIKLIKYLTRFGTIRFKLGRAYGGPRLIINSTRRRAVPPHFLGS